jgi:hypothetical protein
MANAGRFRSTFSGKRALVTGASSGIGEALARRLAAEGCSLILTARREDRLTRLAAELSGAHKVEADVIALDLLEPGAVPDLKQRLDAENLVVDILINNAGFGYQGSFVDLEWDQINDLIDLDIRAMTRMAHVFAKDMIARGTKGMILNVGSIFSFGGVPQYANYSGAKGYVLNFSESLTEELRPHGIGVTMLGPGITRTEFFDTANDGVAPKGAANIMQTADEVAACGIAALAKGKAVAVSGRLYRAITFARRLVPRRVAVVAWTPPPEA